MSSGSFVGVVAPGRGLGAARMARAVAFEADEPGYPPDQVELLCEVHLRAALGLADGDPIGFSVRV